MDILRKKIVIIRLSDIAGESGNVTDFRIRKDILDRLHALKGISRVIITHDRDEREYLAQLKAVEMFVFVYCKVAAGCRASLENIMESLPHNIRKHDLMLSIGDRNAADTMKIEYMDLNDFLS